MTDLKIESLDLAMIVFDIEDTFGIEIPYNANEEVADFKTVGSVVDRVRALIASSGAAAPRRERRLPRLSLRHRRVSHREQRPHAGVRRTAPRRGDRMGVVTPIGSTVPEFWAA